MAVGARFEKFPLNVLHGKSWIIFYGPIFFFYTFYKNLKMCIFLCTRKSFLNIGSLNFIIYFYCCVYPWNVFMLWLYYTATFLCYRWIVSRYIFQILSFSLLRSNLRQKKTHKLRLVRATRWKSDVFVVIIRRSLWVQGEL